MEVPKQRAFPIEHSTTDGHRFKAEEFAAKLRGFSQIIGGAMLQ
jgi:hypothetical protein